MDRFDRDLPARRGTGPVSDQTCLCLLRFDDCFAERVYQRSVDDRGPTTLGHALIRRVRGLERKRARVFATTWVGAVRARAGGRRSQAIREERASLDPPESERREPIADRNVSKLSPIGCSFVSADAHHRLTVRPLRVEELAAVVGPLERACRVEVSCDDPFLSLRVANDQFRVCARRPKQREMAAVVRERELLASVGASLVATNGQAGPDVTMRSTSPAATIDVQGPLKFLATEVMTLRQQVNALNRSQVLSDDRGQAEADLRDLQRQVIAIERCIDEIKGSWGSERAPYCF